MNDTTDLPPPGWYTDPKDPTTQRYWDGSQWTENRSPVQGAAPGTAVGVPVGTAPVGQVGVQPVAIQQQKTNGLAVASMVLGILWLWWVGSILALVFGFVAKKQIDESNGAQSGRGMAIAGLVLGWVGFGTLMLWLLLYALGAVAFIAVAAP